MNNPARLAGTSAVESTRQGFALMFFLGLAMVGALGATDTGASSPAGMAVIVGVWLVGCTVSLAIHWFAVSASRATSEADPDVA